MAVRGGDQHAAPVCGGQTPQFTAVGRELHRPARWEHVLPGDGAGVQIDRARAALLGDMGDPPARVDRHVERRTGVGEVKGLQYLPLLQVDFEDAVDVVAQPAEVESDVCHGTVRGECHRRRVLPAREELREGLPVLLSLIGRRGPGRGTVAVQVVRLPFPRAVVVVQADLGYQIRSGRIDDMELPGALGHEVHTAAVPAEDSAPPVRHASAVPADLRGGHVVAGKPIVVGQVQVAAVRAGDRRPGEDTGRHLFALPGLQVEGDRPTVCPDDHMAAGECRQQSGPRRVAHRGRVLADGRVGQRALGVVAAPEEVALPGARIHRRRAEPVGELRRLSGQSGPHLGDGLHLDRRRYAQVVADALGAAEEVHLVDARPDAGGGQGRVDALSEGGR